MLVILQSQIVWLRVRNVTRQSGVPMFRTPFGPSGFLMKRSDHTDCAKITVGVVIQARSIDQKGFEPLPAR
ncbi:MAG: hypothetical protein ACREI3_09360, partial [Nitrospirales bacterium]